VLKGEQRGRILVAGAPAGQIRDATASRWGLKTGYRRDDFTVYDANDNRVGRVGHLDSKGQTPLVIEIEQSASETFRALMLIVGAAIRFRGGGWKDLRLCLATSISSQRSGTGRGQAGAACPHGLGPPLRRTCSLRAEQASEYLPRSLAQRTMSERIRRCSARYRLVPGAGVATSQRAPVPNGRGGYACPYDSRECRE
jgi:hypothetical protein